MIPNKDIIFSYIDQINDYYQNVAGINVQPFPKVVLDETPNDKNQLQIKTGHYLPKSMKITLMVDNRQLKDILRTYCHELLHHSQNIKDPIGFARLFKGGTLEENPQLKNVEGDAYLNGNLAFRMFTEWLKTNKERNKKMKTTKKTIQPYTLAQYAAKFINESTADDLPQSEISEDDHKSANGGDINKAISDDKLRDEASKFASEKGWFMALVFAYHIARLAQKTFNAVGADDAESTMWSVFEDIKHAMFQAAKEGKLPKEGYKG